MAPWAVRIRSLVGAHSHVDPESARKLSPRAPEPVSFRGSLFTRPPPPKCLNHNAAHTVHHEGQETRGHISCHGDGSRVSNPTTSFPQ